MELIATVKEAWGWTGLDPDQIVGDNDFGNLMVKDRSGRYWRVCPEDLSCKVVADSRSALDALSVAQDFLRDWHMVKLVGRRERVLGLSNLAIGTASRFLVFSAASMAVATWHQFRLES